MRNQKVEKWMEDLAKKYQIPEEKKETKKRILSEHQLKIIQKKNG